MLEVSPRERLSRFVPETAPLEGSSSLDLEGLFAAAASECKVWAQAGIARATPFDGDQTQLKKLESVTICAVPQSENSRLKSKVHSGALLNGMSTSRSGQS